MNILTTSDAWLMRFMDEVCLWLQAKARIRRFYLVPLLTLMSQASMFVRSNGGEMSMVDVALSVCAFIGVLGAHFFVMHPKGPDTDDMTVNTTVEALRHNVLCTYFRLFSFCLFSVLLVLTLIATPLGAALVILEFLFLFYPITIYQQSPPPKTSEQFSFQR